MLPFELETFNEVNIAVPYTAAFYLVSKLNMKTDRDKTDEGIENCLSLTDAFDGTHSCFTFMLGLIPGPWQREEKQI